MATFRATFTESEQLTAIFSGGENLAADFGEVIEVDRHLDFFDGPYEYTPTEETQTIPITMKVASEDIVINPIPSNYGRITWNGAVLSVS